jgi:hypothetical protein
VTWPGLRLHIAYVCAKGAAPAAHAPNRCHEGHACGLFSSLLCVPRRTSHTSHTQHLSSSTYWSWLHFTFQAKVAVAFG